MDDPEVIEAFVTMGARRAFGPSLHIEGDALFLDGWWQTAFRVRHDAFVVRDEEPPRESDALVAVAAELSGRGLHQVGVNLPAITAIIYAELTVGSLSWALWASDLTTGEEALAARAGVESFFAPSILVDDTPNPVDLSVELGGARRLAGLQASLVLTVGLTTAQERQLRESLPECEIVSRRSEEIRPEGCATWMPSVIVVDATDWTGCQFVLELSLDTGCRRPPVAALTQGPEAPYGADLALSVAEPVSEWVESLRQLLP
ncbi:hypothetical protein BH18ACT4_BH18ACT4_15120 [soil metagenome]